MTTDSTATDQAVGGRAIITVLGSDRPGIGRALRA